MKVAVVGSRTCPPVNVGEHLDFTPSLVVSGGARGADTWAAQWAKENGVPLLEFLPEYEKFGRSAPLVRNRTLVEHADFVLAFWDGKSRGTKFTLDYARKLGKPVKVVQV